MQYPSIIDRIKHPRRKHSDEERCERQDEKQKVFSQGRWRFDEITFGFPGNMDKHDGFSSTLPKRPCCCTHAFNILVFFPSYMRNLVSKHVSSTCIKLNTLHSCLLTKSTTGMINILI
ncbi:hypothetical protein NC651_030969 [Populus alba x Populus x berolinensis]|nr:hypothetical protein NC651_030969 [Populus alba x Populus x berolinensis]